MHGKSARLEPANGGGADDTAERSEQIDIEDWIEARREENEIEEEERRKAWLYSQWEARGQ